MKQSNLYQCSEFKVFSIDLSLESLNDRLETALPSDLLSEARLFLFSANREILLHFFSIWVSKVSSFPPFADFLAGYNLALNSDAPLVDLTSNLTFNSHESGFDQSELDKLISILGDRSLSLLAIICLDQIELKRGLKFKVSEHSMRFYCAHVFVRLILSTELLVPPDKIRFGYNHYGKPYLANIPRETSFSFNFSDSENRCALILSFNGEVGLDIEKDSLGLYQGNDKNWPLSEKAKEIVDSGLFFSQKEQLLIKSGGNTQFYRHWTKKEAFLKWLGVGLVDNLAEIDLSLGVHTVTPRFGFTNRAKMEESPIVLDMIPLDLLKVGIIWAQIILDTNQRVTAYHERIGTKFQVSQVDNDKNACFVFTFEYSDLIISCAMTTSKEIRLFNLDEL